MQTSAIYAYIMFIFFSGAIRQSPIANKDGSLSSRIPRFNRRASENIEISKYTTSSIVLDPPSAIYNQSFETDHRNFRYKFKRNSIFEESVSQNNGNINCFSPNNIAASSVADSQGFLRCSGSVQ